MPDREAASTIVVERLKRRSDFRAVSGGARSAGAAFVLQGRARADEGAARVGFTVSRQVGGAVVRNRVRRRLREVVRLSAAGGLLCRGHDYVLIGRAAALAAPFAEMIRDFAAAASRVHAQIGRKERGGTGDAGSRSLHEAGSLSGSRRRRRRSKTQGSSLVRPQSPRESAE